MTEKHAHEVLHMMEGNNYATKAALRSAIVEKFGEDQLFYACSAKGLGVDALIEFLEKKGKFKSAESCDDGFTMDINKVCESY
ncbi:MAG: YecH family metal-binding protein [Rikenellaceae bacterium]